MSKMIQSPSSINTFNQCPRKYYYIYIEGLKIKDNIHTLKGSIIHKVLQNFYDLDLKSFDDSDWKNNLKSYLKELFRKVWKEYNAKIHALKISKEELLNVYMDAYRLTMSWLDYFSTRIQTEMLSLQLDFKDTFSRMIPKREVFLRSEDIGVQGFIDAIESKNNSIRLIDYKTSQGKDMTAEFRLQLGIYALLYKSKHSVLPQKAAIIFMDGKELEILVNEFLLVQTLDEITKVHSKTKSKNKDDYPQYKSGLCKWKSGQCDFHGLCFKQE